MLLWFWQTRKGFGLSLLFVAQFLVDPSNYFYLGCAGIVGLIGVVNLVAREDRELILG